MEPRAAIGAQLWTPVRHAGSAASDSLACDRQLVLVIGGVRCRACAEPLVQSQLAGTPRFEYSLPKST
jgi:hypothetical protein